MAISEMGMKIAAGAGASAAIATPPALGFAYRDQIGNYLKGNKSSESTPPRRDQNAQEGGSSNTPSEDETLKALREKLTALGITDGCQDDNTNKTKTCTVAKEKFKDLFHTGSDTATITLDPEATTFSIRAEKTTEDVDIFDGGFKFTVTSASNIEVQKGSNTGTKVTIKKNTNTEFKMNTTNNKLEKAWDVAKLGKKVNLTCASNSCTATTNALINIQETNGDKTSGAKLPAISANEIGYEDNIEEYNQGFRFTIKKTDGIALTEGNVATGKTATSSLAKDTKYEIKRDAGQWYLVKKTS